MMDAKASLVNRIHAHDFAILEFTLYLDTHSWDKKALRRRQALMAERKNLIAAYESKFGPYVVTAEDSKGDTWCWINDPWPWEYSCRGEN